MKNLNLVLTLSATLMLAACGSKENKTESAPAETATVAAEQPKAAEEPKAEPEAAPSIVGTWKLKDVDLGMTAPKGQEKAMDNLKKEMIAKTVYTFSADGVITLESNMGKSEGTYTLEGNKLTTIIRKKTETVNIQSLTANELVIGIEDHGIKMVMTFQK